MDEKFFYNPHEKKVTIRVEGLCKNDQVAVFITDSMEEVFNVKATGTSVEGQCEMNREVLVRIRNPDIDILSFQGEYFIGDTDSEIQIVRR